MVGHHAFLDFFQFGITLVIGPSQSEVCGRAYIPEVRMYTACECVDYIGCFACNVLSDVPASFVPRGCEGGGQFRVAARVALCAGEKSRFFLWPMLHKSSGDCRFVKLAQILPFSACCYYTAFRENRYVFGVGV